MKIATMTRNATPAAIISKITNVIVTMTTAHNLTNLPFGRII